MSATFPAVQARPATVERVGWRERRRQRKRLAAQDGLSAQIAELVRIRELVAATREVVATGWVQDAWYVCADTHGRQRCVSVLQKGDLRGGPVARACLVGAVLQAAGGVTTVDSQRVQRTFDLLWHTLYRSEREPVRWCPAPPIRAQQLRDLVQWNDQPGRTSADVETLLCSALHRVDGEVARNRHQLAELAESS